MGGGEGSGWECGLQGGARNEESRVQDRALGQGSAPAGGEGSGGWQRMRNLGCRRVLRAGIEGFRGREGDQGWGRELGHGERLRGAWKQRHVTFLGPTRRHGQAALHAAPSRGTAPAAPTGCGSWQIGAAGAAPETGAASRSEPPGCPYA